MRMTVAPSRQKGGHRPRRTSVRRQTFAVASGIAVIVQACLLSGPVCAEGRDPHSGLYAIWYGKAADRFLSQPFASSTSTLPKALSRSCLPATSNVNHCRVVDVGASWR